MKQLFILMFTIMCYFGYSQNSCYTELAVNSISESGEFTIQITQESKMNKIVFKNRTKDTLYIFSSYFEKRFYNSQYLNRINKKGKELKLSFLPLLPYLTTSKSDRILPGSNALVTKGQLNYRFILLPPNTSIDKEFYFEDNESIDYSRDIDVSELNMYDRLKFKSKRKCSKSDSYEKVIEFAVYRDIDNLCDSNYFYKHPEKYNNIAKDYEKYTSSR